MHLFLLVTVVEAHPKVPFLIATTPKCGGGYYAFHSIAQLTFDPYLKILSVKQRVIKYQFLGL